MIRNLFSLLFLSPLLALGAERNFPEHAIEVKLNPVSGDIRITDRMQISGRTRYRFQLAPWLELKGLSLDGQPARLDREARDYSLTLPDESVHEIRFELLGKVPPRDSNSWHSSGADDGIYLPGYDAWIPRDEVGAMHYRLRVEVPEPYRAVATGRLEDELTEAGYYRATFIADGEGEAPSLFAGPYEIEELHRNGLRLRTYFHAGSGKLASLYLESAAAYIERYQRMIGPYPYADFDLVSAPLPVGLGFPSLVYVDRRILPLPFMRTRSLAHEVLHNWWGNGVAVDYVGGNWAEGLTTYLADYGLAVDEGDAAARAMRIKWLRDYAALPAERDQAVIEFVTRQHQAAQVIGYDKVAYIFHMLAAEIGQQAFSGALRELWRTHRFGKAGWRDLQGAFERSAGTSLDWFFAQWLTRRGAPQLELGEHVVTAVDDGYTTTLTLRQSAPVYRLRLPLRLSTNDGDELRELVIEQATSTVEFTTRARPLAVQIDPDSHVFRRLLATETPTILRDVTLHPATLTLVASDDTDFRNIGRELAAAMLDTAPRFVDAAKLPPQDVPILLIADGSKLQDLRNRLQLEVRSQQMAPWQSAGAWTTRRSDGVPVLIVTARDATSLGALLRPLPHYGGQSHVEFDGSQARGKGVWPVGRGALYRDLTRPF